MARGRPIFHFNINHNQKQHVMRSFVKRTAYSRSLVGALDEPATKVKNNMYLNSGTFVDPPMPAAEFAALVLSYTAKYRAFKDGGATAKAEFLQVETALMNAMNDAAFYVDTVADGDSAIVILAGFEPTKETQTPKAKPVQIEGVELLLGEPGELIGQCDKQEGVDVYVAILTAGNPVPSSIKIDKAGQLMLSDNEATPEFRFGSTDTSAIIDFTKGRKKSFLGLTPGVIYYITYFGINATGVGQMSDPVARMCN